MDQRVQARAYALWEEEGRPEGRSAHHWHEARAQIESEDVDAERPGSRAPAAGAKKRKNTKVVDLHPGMMGDGTEEQNLGQEGDPAARITEAEVHEAFKTEDGGT
jgi:hypothetical protein